MMTCLASRPRHGAPVCAHQRSPWCWPPPPVETLLAPWAPGHWSRKAEEWAEARDTADWRDVEANKRLRRQLSEARGREAELLAECEAKSAELRARCPDV